MIISSAKVPAPAMAAGPEGLWLVKDQTGRIRIEKCNNLMWGSIAWQKDPSKDVNNPNPALKDKPQTIDDLMFPNYVKEIFLDSDTKVSCISGSYSEDEKFSFLTNDMKRDAREKVEDGEHDWFTSPRIDSYHTVWMQWHEDLLLALGREREQDPQ